MYTHRSLISNNNHAYVFENFHYTFKESTYKQNLLLFCLYVYPFQLNSNCCYLIVKIINKYIN